MCAFLGERHAVVDWQGLHHLLAQLPRTALKKEIIMMKGFESMFVRRLQKALQQRKCRHQNV